MFGRQMSLGEGDTIRPLDRAQIIRNPHHYVGDPGRGLRLIGPLINEDDALMPEFLRGPCH